MASSGMVKLPKTAALRRACSCAGGVVFERTNLARPQPQRFQLAHQELRGSELPSAQVVAEERHLPCNWKSAELVAEFSKCPLRSCGLQPRPGRLHTVSRTAKEGLQSKWLSVTTVGLCLMACSALSKSDLPGTRVALLAGYRLGSG